MKQNRRLVLFPLVVLVVLTLATPLFAAPPSVSPEWCGTHPARSLVAEARHQYFQRQLALQRQNGQVPVKSALTISQVGQIAVLDDDGTVTALPRTFDLVGRSIRFLRRPGGMSAAFSPLRLRELIGDRLDLGDDDSVEVDFPDGFRFPFGDRTYDSVFVNSNGNLTFGQGDLFLGGLFGLLLGPPRIAALFTDLDPSAAEGENGVYVSLLEGRVRVTWLAVPEFSTTNSNTVQVTLYETGRVNVAFGDVDALDPVVGVAPIESMDLMDLLQVDFDEELPIAPHRGVIAQQFTDFPEVDVLGAVRLFAEQYQDIYDSVFVWLDFPAIIPGFAFSVPLRNDVRGIGLPLFDDSPLLVPGTSNLKSLVQMGDLGRFPDDPDEIFMTTASTMTVLGHEFGHRWLAFVRFVNQSGRASWDLLNGRRGIHWSFHMSAQGSVMHGNYWADNGDGTFTATADAHTRYSPLDRYLMGLASPASVPDFFYVAHPDGGFRGALPVIGQTITGERVDVSLEDVIAIEGPRVPPRAASPSSFRTAFLLVGLVGQGVSQEAIDKVDRFRRRWVSFFHEATGRRGEMKTGLFPK